MNFLQLCQRLRSEAGLSGTGPSSVVGQTGYNGKIVDWIQSAYTDVQNIFSDWKYLQADFSFNTTSGKQTYTPAEAGLTDHEKWKTNTWDSFRFYLASASVATEQYIEYMDWDSFRPTFFFGAQKLSTGQPQYCSIKPDKSLIFYNIPNDIYTITGEYFKKADELSGNTDEPNFPSQFHLILVWRALMFYGAYDAAEEKYTHGQNEFTKVLSSLKTDRRQVITWGPPLA